MSETQGTEPSKYLEEKKSNEIPLVAASERGRAQTINMQGLYRCIGGVVGLYRVWYKTDCGVRNLYYSRSLLGSDTEEGKSPVYEIM